jgi:hypothetical protein
MKPAILLGASLLSVTLLVSYGPAYSDFPDGESVPAECEPANEGNEFVHTFGVSKFPVGPDPDEPIFPGDDVIAIANFNNPLNPQFQTEDITEIRFLWFDGSGTLQQETVVPVDTDTQTIAEDKFLGVYGPGMTWEVIACYEGTNVEGNDRTIGVNTVHLDVDSFFVLPESPVGTAALISASLASLGAFMFLRSRHK